MWTVDNDIKEVLLYQVTPGSEHIVAEELGKQAQVFLALSEFDLVALKSNSGLPHIFDNHSSVALSVRDVQETIAFGWREAKGIVQPELANGSAVAFTFVKLNAMVVNDHGLHAEQEFLEYLFEQAPKFSEQEVTVEPLSTLGWNEILLIWRATSFSAITQCILTLGQWSPTEFGSLLRKGQPLVSNTHTIPCIPLTRDELKAPYASTSFEKIRDPIRPEIYIASSDGYHATIADKIIGAFQDYPLRVSTILGYYDLVVAPEQVEIPAYQLAELVAYIRNPDSCPGVLCTDISIAGPLPGDATNVLPPPRNRAPENISRMASQVSVVLERLTEVEASNSSPRHRFAQNLAQIMTSFLSTYAAGETEGVIDDLIPFVEKLLHKTDELVDTSAPVTRSELYESLENVHLLYKFGFDQRMTGVRTGLANMSRSATALRPISLQRILGATNSVPRFLFNQTSDHAWNGFNVFGYSTDALRLDAGVINIPIDYMLDPAQWWILIHETGHEFGVQLDLVSLPVFRQVIDRYCQIVPEIERARAREFAVELCEEFFADVYTFVTVCDSDWRFFLKIQWQFFYDYPHDQFASQKVTEFVLRCLFVLSVYLEQQNALSPGERLTDAIQRGQKMQGNLLARDLDHPGYSQNENLVRNLVHRAFGEYESLTDLIEREIIKPVTAMYPHLVSSMALTSAQKVATSYEVFEDTRSEVVKRVGQIAPNIQKKKERHPLALLQQFRKSSADPNWMDLSGLTGQLWQKLSKGRIENSKYVTPYQIIAILKRIELGYDIKASQDELTRAKLASILSLWHMDKVNRSNTQLQDEK